MAKLKTNGVDLHYEVAGAGEPVLFIHGLGSSLLDWEKQVNYFAKEYEVTVFDLRGHGRSGKAAGLYSISLFVSDTVALIRSLKLAPVHLVGISLGGMIALELAVSEPELVRSLVVVNSPSEVTIRSFKDRLMVWQRFFIAGVLGMRQVGRFLGGRLFPEPQQGELRKVFVERWAENDPAAYRAAMKAIVGWSVTDRLDQIKCPTLVVAAEYDYTPLEDKELLAARIDQAELVLVENSRHGTPVDRPEEFNHVVADFLHRVQRGCKCRTRNSV